MNDGAVYAVIVCLADGHAPIVLRGVASDKLQVLRYTIEQSIAGIWPTADRQCLGRQILILGGELVIAARITRVQILPDAALDMPPEQRPPKVGFELFPAMKP